VLQDVKNEKKQIIVTKERIDEKAGKELYDALSKSNAVTTLTLEFCTLDSEGAFWLAKVFVENPNLQHLHLRETSMDMNGCRHLADAIKQNALETLEWPCVYENEEASLQILSNALVESLTHREEHLKRLSLRFVELDGLGCKHIKQVLMKGNLESIALHRNEFDSSGWKEICEGLMQNETVKKLEVSANELGEEECKYLVQILEHNSTLQELYLCENNLTRAGLNIICLALSTNEVMRKLTIRENGINDEGCSIIAKMLLQNHTLSVLSLENNSILFTGCKYLRDVLGNKKATLISLDVSSNPLGDLGCKFIAEMIERNNSLTYLNVENCRLGDTGVSHLGAAIGKMNISLRYLKMNQRGWQNYFQGMKAFVKYLRARPGTLHLELGVNYHQTIIEDKELRVREGKNPTTLVISSKKLWNTTVSKQKSLLRRLKLSRALFLIMKEVDLPLEVKWHICEVGDEKSLLSPQEKHKLMKYGGGNILTIGKSEEKFWKEMSLPPIEKKDYPPFHLRWRVMPF